jgi:hypothetical protein
MFRRYNRWQSCFDQPDPYDGSYELTNPQSFNRYAYVQGDPVNFVNLSGLDKSGHQGGTDGKEDFDVISTDTWDFGDWWGWGWGGGGGGFGGGGLIQPLERGGGGAVDRRTLQLLNNPTQTVFKMRS